MEIFLHVFCNEQLVYTTGGDFYMPIYYCMFLEKDRAYNEADLVVPQVEMPPCQTE